MWESATGTWVNIAQGKTDLVELAPHNLVLAFVLLDGTFALIGCHTHLRTKRGLRLIDTTDFVSWTKTSAQAREKTAAPKQTFREELRAPEVEALFGNADLWMDEC